MPPVVEPLAQACAWITLLWSGPNLPATEAPAVLMMSESICATCQAFVFRDSKEPLGWPPH